MGRVRWFAVVVAVAAGAVVGGCSSAPAPPTTAELVHNLGILKSQQQFTDAQVRCVAEQAESSLQGKDLRRFATALQALNASGSTDGMDPLSLKTFTAAITTCAASGG